MSWEVDLCHRRLSGSATGGCENMGLDASAFASGASRIAEQLTDTEVARLTGLVGESKVTLCEPTPPLRATADQAPPVPMSPSALGRIWRMNFGTLAGGPTTKGCCSTPPRRRVRVDGLPAARLPAARLPAVVDRLRQAVAADRAVERLCRNRPPALRGARPTGPIRHQPSRRPATFATSGTESRTSVTVAGTESRASSAGPGPGLSGSWGTVGLTAAGGCRSPAWATRVP